ncbi:MAG: undecaprenyl/decaprenyl-phosphate alpha-N-acetylglucosaminyl 1-phosphate transferase [Candidatus Gracilibacteria bacterium]|nr:undecaprenyl/decaprenyl-phosphate alpha-N-acetylglucosaminyl 1-phosphate transferase [Candidatus Gracilibacteria bacterium]
MDPLAVLVLGAFTAAVVVRRSVQVFPWWGLLDFPQRYGLHRKKIPYPGGLTLVLLVLAFFLTDQSFWPLAIAVAALGAVSFWDDREPLPIWSRGIVHVAAAGFVLFSGVQISQLGNPLGGDVIFLSAGLSAALTLIWIVVIQNALNWFDGLKGLSVGVSGIGFLALGIFGLVRPEVAWEPALPAFLRTVFFLTGICAGSFLWFFRGKILLGDTGSQVLGFLLAVFSILAGTKIGTTLLVLGLPILDLIFVSARRMFLEKRSPFSGDRRHLHHNLARKLSEPKAVLLLIAISAALGAIGIFLTGWHKLTAFLVVAVGIFFLSVWAGRAKSK